MRHLFEYISKQDIKVIIPEYNFKEAPDQLKNKISIFIKDLVNGDIKDIIIKSIDDWYHHNSTKRNINAISKITTFLYINDKEDKLLSEVINEMERIGVTGSPVNEFDSIGNYPSWSSYGRKCGDVEINLSSSTYKQFEEGNYKYGVSVTGVNTEFISSSHKNGYNDLSTEDMNVIRRKLYDCMTNTKCMVIQYSNPMKDNKYVNSAVPEFRVILSAVYNKNKLKSLLDELKSDKRLQSYADKMDTMSKGIRDYYTDKKPGDYVGD